MTQLSRARQKRLATTGFALLSGVAMAGFVSNIIEAPVGSNDYLHEHLTISVTDGDPEWVQTASRLSAQDRREFSSTIIATERPDWQPDEDSLVTGQALNAASAARCTAETLPCSSSVRLLRRFSDTHVNADRRVVNVTETSLRVPILWSAGPTDLQLEDFTMETRLFRFHQAQAGWVQTTSEVIETETVFVADRDGLFADRFAPPHIGLNYYPATASWKEFWTEFPVDEIDEDLRTIRNIGGNAVRIFINHDYFDQIDTREHAAEKLRILLDLCAAHDIRVIVTLFDLRPDYTLSNLAQDAAHIDRVLGEVASHPAILGLDIKNQADLDFDGWGEPVVKAWLTVMARYIQMQYPDLPVTVGWSRPEQALQLADIVDVVTYHEYGNPDGFAERLAAIRSGAESKPVMITELGSTVWTPLRSTQAAEAHQASRLDSQLRQSAMASGVFVWTLNDFDHIGNDVVGRRPWRKAQQRQFGLHRSDGSPRPARTVFRSHAQRLTSQSNQPKS